MDKKEQILGNYGLSKCKSKNFFVVVNIAFGRSGPSTLKNDATCTCQPLNTVTRYEADYSDFVVNKQEMEAQLQKTCDSLYKRCYLIRSKLNDPGCSRSVELDNCVRHTKHPMYKHNIYRYLKLPLFSIEYRMPKNCIRVNYCVFCMDWSYLLCISSFLKHISKIIIFL